MSVIEPEAQLAGLMGYSNDIGGAVFDKGDGSQPVAAKNLTLTGTSTGVSGVFDQCGKNFTMNVMAPVQAEDGAWKLGCTAGGTGYLAGTDTLTLRFSGTSKADPVKGRLQVMARRLKADNTRLFVNGTAPFAIKDEVSEVRDFFVKTYYISPDSDGRPNLPSLRVKQIIDKGGDGDWDDQEVVRGVEDMQIELGIDPGADLNGDGAIDMENGVAKFTNGDVARYVAPSDAIIKSGQVVSIRLWLRVRAEQAEQGFEDTRTYSYASVTNFQPKDGFRRVLISRTIFVRNTRSYPTT